MEYSLQYKKGTEWTNWGFKTSSEFDIKQKIDYVRRALGSSCPKLRYVARVKDSLATPERGGVQLF